MHTCNVHTYSLQKLIFLHLPSLQSPAGQAEVGLVVGESHHPLAGAAPGAVVRARGRGGGGAGGGVVAGIPTQWW